MTDFQDKMKKEKDERERAANELKMREEILTLRGLLRDALNTIKQLQVALALSDIANQALIQKIKNQNASALPSAPKKFTEEDKKFLRDLKIKEE